MYGRSLMVRLGTVLIIIELSRWSYYTTESGCFLSSMMSEGCLMGCNWNRSALGSSDASLFHGWVVCGCTHCWFSIGFRGYRGCGCRCLWVQLCCGLIFPQMLAVSAKRLSRWSLHYIWAGFNTSLCNNCRGPFTWIRIIYSSTLPFEYVWEVSDVLVMLRLLVWLPLILAGCYFFFLACTVGALYW